MCDLFFSRAEIGKIFFFFFSFFVGHEKFFVVKFCGNFEAKKFETKKFRWNFEQKKSGGILSGNNPEEFRMKKIKGSFERKKFVRRNFG